MNIKEFLNSQSQESFAKNVGVSQAMVSKWFLGTRVAGDSVMKVAIASDWQVTPHELRPDLYPHPEDGLPAHLRHVA